MLPLPIREPNAESGQGRMFFDKLVILRGLGVTAIFALHFFGDIFHKDGYSWNGLWLNPLSEPSLLFHLCSPITYGWTAIFLFFVISGFVIHNSFLRGGEFNIRAFYWRRWWRLYPPYLLAMLCFCVLNRVDVTSGGGAWQLISHLLLIQNFHASSFHGIAPTLWYVAAEFQLYLLFPLLLFFRQQFGMRNTLLFTLGLSIVSRLVGMALVELDDSDPTLAIWLFPSAIWFDWTLGAYLAECYYKGERAFPVTTRQLAGLIVLFVAMTFFLPTKAFSTQLVSFIFAVVIEKYLRASDRLKWYERAILPVGWCSYSLYLWHEPLSYRVLWKLESWGLPDRGSVEMTIGMALVFLAVFAWSFFAFASVERWGKRAGSYLWQWWQPGHASHPTPGRVPSHRA